MRKMPSETVQRKKLRQGSRDLAATRRKRSVGRTASLEQARVAAAVGGHLRPGCHTAAPGRGGGAGPRWAHERVADIVECLEVDPEPQRRRASCRTRTDSGQRIEHWSIASCTVKAEHRRTARPRLRQRRPARAAGRTDQQGRGEAGAGDRGGLSPRRKRRASSRTSCSNWWCAPRSVSHRGCTRQDWRRWPKRPARARPADATRHPQPRGTAPPRRCCSPSSGGSQATRCRTRPNSSSTGPTSTAPRRRRSRTRGWSAAPPSVDGCGPARHPSAACRWRSTARSTIAPRRVRPPRPGWPWRRR